MTNVSCAWQGHSFSWSLVSLLRPLVSRSRWLRCYDVFMNNEPLHNAHTSTDRPDFDAILMPYRSLGPRGFVVLMTLVVIVSFAAGIFFASLGAWPVFGFFGLDALLVYIGFKLNYRAVRQQERVTLVGSQLVVSETLASGRVRTAELDAYWVRVGLVPLSQERVRLVLRSHGREFPIGRFLNDDEKRSFADALSIALRNFRTSVPS